MRVRSSIAAIILAVTLAGSARGAVLYLGNGFGDDEGRNAVLPMTLDCDSGEEVAALQCELVFDSRVLMFVNVTAGPTATAAGKTVFSNQVRPGRVRCIVAGLNQTAIPDGEVFSVAFSVAAGTPDDAYYVDIENAILSDPDGQEVDAAVYYGAVLTGDARHHAADTNGDWIVTVSELLRVVQFFNTIMFHCQAGTEDGYAVGTGAQDCRFHDSDYMLPRNWSISIAELLRLIQLFNSKAYHVSLDSEDGYAPGVGREEPASGIMIEREHRPDIRRARLSAACGAGVVALLYVGGAFGATLSTSHATSSGGLIAVTVLLRPDAGESIAGAQFDVRVDPGLYEVHEVITGDAAASAGKEVAVGAHGDALTILVAGFNQYAMSEGVLATIYLAPLGEPPAVWPSIEAAVLSDPFGKQVQATISPEPKTVDPTADDTESPQSQSAPAQPESELPAAVNNDESGTRTSARTGYGGLADNEDEALSEPVFVPPSFGTGRKASASPAMRAPSEAERFQKDAPAAAAGGYAGAIPTPEMPGRLEETTAGDSPARREVAQRVNLAHATAPLATGESAATGASLSANAAARAGGAVATTSQARWEKPVLFVMSLALIISVFPLRRRLLGKGRS